MPRPRLSRNKQEFMNILYGPKIKVKLAFPNQNFFRIIPMNDPLVKNKLTKEQNRFRRDRYALLFDPKNNVQNFYKIYSRVKNTPVVRNPFVEYEPLMRRAGTIKNSVKKVQKAVRNKKMRVKSAAAAKIQTHWRYRPGGPGYRSAMKHAISIAPKGTFIEK